MRISSNTLVLIIGMGLLFSSGNADRKIVPPTSAEVTHAWVGYDNYGQFIRLSLEKMNVGTLVILPLYPESSVYRIENWTLIGTNLSIRAVPVTSNDEQIQCTVSNVNSRNINLIIAGSNSKWQRTVELVKEDVLLKKIQESTLKAASIKDKKENRAGTD